MHFTRFWKAKNKKNFWDRLFVYLEKSETQKSIPPVTHVCEFPMRSNARRVSPYFCMLSAANVLAVKAQWRGRPSVYMSRLQYYSPHFAENWNWVSILKFAGIISSYSMSVERSYSLHKTQN